MLQGRDSWGRAACVCATLLMLASCTGVFFHPDRRTYFSPQHWGLAHEDIDFHAADGTRLHAWLLPAVGAARGTILFLHGNAQNISAHLASVAWLPERGYNVFLLDYRGYGSSQGTPQLDGLFADIEAAADYIARRDDLHAAPLVIFGQSLGGALAITAAAGLQSKYAIAAVVSESAFSSYRTIAREKLGQVWFTWPLRWPLSLAFADDVSPRRFAGKISPIPLLIVHGEADVVVPDHHARILYDAAIEPKELWLLPGVGHIAAVDRPEFRERLLQWLDATLPPSHPASP